jgi:hypothetical protein
MLRLESEVNIQENQKSRELCISELIIEKIVLQRADGRAPTLEEKKAHGNPMPPESEE